MSISPQQKPFIETMYISLHVQNDFIQLKFFDEAQQLIGAERAATKLFYKYEPNFYGLQANITNNELIVRMNEFLDMLSARFSHPFLQLQGMTSDDEALLQTYKQLAKQWMDPALWSHIEIQDTVVCKLPHNEILETAVTQQLQQLGLTTDYAKALQPIFQAGGWPLTTHQTLQDGVKLALRLSEPDDLQTTWTLETVLVAPTGKPWTPAVRKRGLPVTEALPEKWLHFAPQLEQQLQQLHRIFQGISLTAPTNQMFSLLCTEADIREFLKQDLALIQAIGFEIILPAWLKELKQSKMKVRINASSGSNKAAALDDVLQFKWQFSMNGEQISAEDFKRLVDQQREFVQIGTEWFRMDAQWLADMRALMEQAETEDWTVRDLLFQDLPSSLTNALFEDEDDDRDDPLLAFEIQRSLQQYVEQLQNKQGLPSIAPPSNLQAELRPYQQQGFEWLCFMREQQFGACLADDMGLGKTVQTISYLLHTYDTLQLEQPTIIICPTSVLGNWQKELARFAPSLNVYIHYGAARAKDDMLHTQLKQAQPHIILSTYGTVSQDASFLQNFHFATIVLDEAQNIKNMHTLQSRAIRKLSGAHHIALTGTPVENRLSELWAIFDFIHKGYLGSFKTFQNNYITPIERDDSLKEKQALRLKIQPFLLRRTKRDPELLLNLPEKQESNEFCPLTIEQAALYEGYIQDTLAGLEQLTGFEKKGRILKMLNKLKQLCNHPALYLKEPFDDAQAMLKRSNKLSRLVQMTKEIVDSGEQCLIFTQYIGMGNLIQHCLAELYDIDAPFLTGSTTKQQRDHLVDTFQAGQFPVFILSLKAGGTGLNLTAANHVLHADRWWNPAVENQATDRAYRIGQTQFVQVHKFVTLGTIEEKIDKMLTVKSALSEELIQSSQWITELDDSEILALMQLDK